VSRGDLIARPNNQPEPTREIDARICWLDDQAMRPGARYVVRHMASEVAAKISELTYRIDINTLHRLEEENPALEMNDIARVKIRCATPLFMDDYRRNRTTGSFILIDPSTRRTVAAGVQYS
jgi:sulfate adenylyltransferase subunit 1